MSKRRNSNRNSNSAVKRFFRKPIVQMICVSLVVVLVLGLFGTITDGFSNWAGEDMKNEFSTLHLNKKNMFFDVIKDETLLDNNYGKATAKNGVITLNYEKADTDDTKVDIAETIEFATIKLKAGEYTLSAMKNEDWTKCYVVGTYAVSGITHTWYADYEKVPGSDTSTTFHGRTLTLDAETDVTFAIRVCEGAKLENVKITPVLVEGENEGNYYAGLLGLIG